MRSLDKIALISGVAVAALMIPTVARAARRPSATRAPTSPRFPEGKGVFVERSFFNDAARVFRDLGIRWILIETWIQKLKGSTPARDAEGVRRVLEKINPPGAPPIQIWGWGWPVPGQIETFATHVNEILATPVHGYCFDVEVASWGTKKIEAVDGEAELNAMIARVRSRTNRPLLLSSHGRADYARLPWNALTRLDGALPQAYDGSNLYGDGFIHRCVQSYVKKGFSWVAPTLGATHKTSAERMQEQLDDLPDVPAVSWWTWTKLGASPERREVVQRFDHRRAVA